VARISFEMRDGAGDLVRFESGDHEFGDLLKAYEGTKQMLIKAGFEPVKAKSGFGKPKPKIKLDGKTCPFCHSPLYDNREKKASGQFNPKAPDFTCSNKACTGSTGKDGSKRPFAVWPGQYEIDEAA